MISTFYTVPEVAEHYGVTQTTVTRWIRRGRLQAVNLGGNRAGPYRITAESMREFEMDNVKGTPPALPSPSVPSMFHYKGMEVRITEKDGEPWFVLKDVCQILDLSTPARVAERLDPDEKGMSLTHTLGGPQEMTVVNEPGLYNVIFRSDKPEAKPFKRWVTHEVLPMIRRTGQYTAPGVRTSAPPDDLHLHRAELLTKIADQYDGTYRQILHAHATRELTGEYLLPLPKQERKTFSAAEVGERLGISANMVGRLANMHNLKTPEFGSWYLDKAKDCDKVVQSFRYYETIVPVLQGLLS